MEAGAILFGSEHQGRMAWGLPIDDPNAPDPCVLQRGAGEIQWTKKYKLSSVFLLHMMCWQLINALPSAARCSSDSRAITAFREEMTVLSNNIGYGMQSLVDFRRGIFVTVLTGQGEVYVGARDDETLSALEMRTSIEFDWL
jgi:hypothetical protein